MRLCATKSAIVAALIFGAIGIALDVRWVPHWSGADVPAPALPEPVELEADTGRRCPSCGWIEAIREIVPAVPEPGSAAIYEYTLRRSDGSSEVFQEALPTRWRMGERIKWSP